MYAIVEIAGQQFKVEKDQKVFVHRLEGAEGDVMTFDKVFLLDNGDITIGAPVIAGAKVTAKILRHLKGDKVIVFKKKRRKGYKKKNGHRQSLTEVKVDSISAPGVKAVASTKKASKKASASSKKSGKDDLKKIEGIGPKIESVLNEVGVLTYADLAKMTPKKITEIIKDVRGSHKTNTWPEQSQMAVDGKWDELKKWQDELDGGVQK